MRCNNSSEHSRQSRLNVLTRSRLTFCHEAVEVSAVRRLVQTVEPI
jgi:hypothetical protein